MTPKWAIIHCIYIKGGNDDVLEREGKMHGNSACVMSLLMWQC